MCCSWLLDAQFPWDYLCLPVLASALGCLKMSADGVCRVGTGDGGDAGKPSPSGCCAACASWGPFLAEPGAGFEVGFGHGEEVRELLGWAERVGWRGKAAGFLALKLPFLGQGLAHAGAAEAVPARGSALGGFPPLTWGHSCWRPRRPYKGPILSTTSCWSLCCCSARLVLLCIAGCLGKTASDAFLC